MRAAWGWTEVHGVRWRLHGGRADLVVLVRAARLLRPLLHLLQGLPQESIADQVPAPRGHLPPLRSLELRVGGRRAARARRLLAAELAPRLLALAPRFLELGARGGKIAPKPLLDCGGAIGGRGRLGLLVILHGLLEGDAALALPLLELRLRQIEGE